MDTRPASVDAHQDFLGRGRAPGTGKTPVLLSPAFSRRRSSSLCSRAITGSVPPEVSYCLAIDRASFLAHILGQDVGSLLRVA